MYRAIPIGRMTPTEPGPQPQPEKTSQFHMLVLSMTGPLVGDAPH